MKSRKIFIGMIALVIGITLMGCVSTNPTNTEKVAWSDYTKVPNKDYVVMGAIVIRGIDIKTVNADLMEKAIALGAHNIINVRVDIEQISTGKRVIAASAVAIKYTDETIKTKHISTTTTSSTNNMPSTTTTTDEYETIYFGGTGTGETSKAVSLAEEPKKKKKVLGIF